MNDPNHDKTGRANKADSAIDIALYLSEPRKQWAAQYLTVGPCTNPPGRKTRDEECQTADWVRRDLKALADLRLDLGTRIKIKPDIRSPPTVRMDCGGPTRTSGSRFWSRCANSPN
jgi:hypothetical protein